jgi:hypothetical protein
MNSDRLEELAKQCWSYYIDGVLIDGHLHFDYVKFAELIVKECASLFELTFTDEQYQRRIDKTIRKHFGLEE